MLDEITGPEEIEGAQTGGWGLDPLPVVGDAGYGEATEFRLGLEDRHLSYVLAVKATTSAYPADAEPMTPRYSGRGRPPIPRARPHWPHSPWERDDEGCGGSPGATAAAQRPGTRPPR